MTSRVPRALLIAVLLGAAVAVAFTASLGADYPAGPCPRACDYAGPPISALIHGKFHSFFSEQPLMGPFSLLLRAPFAAVASALHGGLLWEYRLGVLACLLALAALGAGLWQAMERRDQPVLARVAAVALLVAGPLTFKALFWGHPEELLGAALCVGALVLAARGRVTAAGLLLGLAIATKQWAVLAILPVLMAASEQRVRLAVVAVATGGLLLLPMLLGDSGRFFTQNHFAAGQADDGISPTNVWWAYAHQAGDQIAADGTHSPFYALPGWLLHTVHPLIIALAVALPLLYRRVRPDRRPEDLLLLLALIFLLRCLLDTQTYSYHHAPFLIALVAYEGMRRRGLPVLSMFAALMLWLTGGPIADLHDPAVLNRFYVAWALPLAGYLVLSLYFPAKATSIEQRLRLQRPVGTPAG